MHTLLFLMVLGFHLAAARPFLIAIRERRVPSALDFACVSFLVYYDLGMGLELLGYSLRNSLYTSLFGVDVDTYLGAVVLLAVAPWALRFGSWIVNKGRTYEPPQLVVEMGRRQRRYFYVITAALVVPITAFALLNVHASQSIWLVRSSLSNQLGVLLIILYVPVSILCFYLSVTESRTRKGTVVIILLGAASVGAALPVGERSLVLVPLLVIALVRLRLSVTRLLIYAASLLVAASLMLTAFKWQYAGTAAGPDTLVADTISSDIARAPTLGAALHASVPIGTRVAPYPFAGYTYSLLFFVPRQVAPFKGTSTAQDFTAYLVGGSPDQTGWGVGMGAVEEILLNGGFLLVFPILVLYGMGLAYLDRLSVRAPVIATPVRLAALWICAYHLPALLQLYGFMALLGVGLQWWFRDKARPVQVMHREVPAPAPASVRARRVPRLPSPRVPVRQTGREVREGRA